MVSTNTQRPAHLLEGSNLDEGWHVDAPLLSPDGSTGGQFSATYYVTNTDPSSSHYGLRGFLKALDYGEALASPNRAEALQAMTAAYLHERDLIEMCSNRRMRHVVKAITSGQFTVPNCENGEVDYLILEIARSDVRFVMDHMDDKDLLWVFGTLHNVANGLRQLHSANITHQDIKPSNILDFGEERKITDLGRAHLSGATSPYDDLVIPGDRSYAPPEQLYEYQHPNEGFRRRAADLYQLGNLMLYLLTGVSFNGILYSNMDEEHQPKRFGGDYFDVVSMLEIGLVDATQNLRDVLPSASADTATAIFTQLAQPDVRLRGIPRRQRETQDRVSMEYYVSKFDALRLRARY